MTPPPTTPARASGEGRRSVIVLNHLFKTAGSTLAWAFRQSFGGRFADYRRLKAEGVWSEKDLVEFLRRCPQVRAVEIHHFACGLVRHAGFAFGNILFVRHPLDRLRSTYDFYRQRPPSKGPLIPVAQNNDLRGFLEYLLRQRTPHVENQQVRRLCRLDHPPTRGDLQAAVNTVRRAAVPGVVSRFDDSAVLGEISLRASFPELDLSYAPRNVSSGRPPTLHERMEQLAGEIGRELYDELTALNKLDIELIEAADRELDSRIRATESFAERKADFLSRCRRHEPPGTDDKKGTIRRFLHSVRSWLKRLP